MKCPHCALETDAEAPEFTFGTPLHVLNGIARKIAVEAMSESLPSFEPMTHDTPPAGPCYYIMDFIRDIRSDACFMSIVTHSPHFGHAIMVAGSDRLLKLEDLTLVLRHRVRFAVYALKDNIEDGKPELPPFGLFDSQSGYPQV